MELVYGVCMKYLGQLKLRKMRLMDIYELLQNRKTSGARGVEFWSLVVHGE
jgi:hypothetical protein